MHVGVDQARNGEVAGGVERRDALRRFEPHADVRDATVADEDGVSLDERLLEPAGGDAPEVDDQQVAHRPPIPSATVKPLARSLRRERVAIPITITISSAAGASGIAMVTAS